MSGYRLPPVPPCEIPGCPECAELAAALDADLAARLRVALAAEKADRLHHLNAPFARSASGPAPERSTP